MVAQTRSAVGGGGDGAVPDAAPTGPVPAPVNVPAPPVAPVPAPQAQVAAEEAVSDPAPPVAPVPAPQAQVAAEEAVNDPAPVQQSSCPDRGRAPVRGLRRLGPARARGLQDVRRGERHRRAVGGQAQPQPGGGRGLPAVAEYRLLSLWRSCLCLLLRVPGLPRLGRQRVRCVQEHRVLQPRVPEAALARSQGRLCSAEHPRAAQRSGRGMPADTLAVQQLKEIRRCQRYSLERRAYGVGCPTRPPRRRPRRITGGSGSGQP
jgi:hypothetical protein